jgi:hypothetical protein
MNKQYSNNGYGKCLVAEIEFEAKWRTEEVFG